jgi:hypothetical protein
MRIRLPLLGGNSGFEFYSWCSCHVEISEGVRKSVGVVNKKLG